MMSKTASNQGSSSGMADVKYQKAIKQISKLISLNTSLKKQIAGLQETNQKLKLEVQALQQKYNSLQHQCKRNKEEAQKSPAITLSQVSCSHDESGSFVQNLENKRRIQKLQQKIIEKQERINKLKTELDQKITQNKQLYLRNIDLTEQVTKLKTYQNMKGYQAVDNERKKLKRELQKSEEMAKKLSQDYEIMIKQLQFNEKGSINAKSIELDIGMSQSIGQPKDPLSDFYFQKLKKIETENLKLKKQYSEKKQKLKVQIKKLKEQNQNQFGKMMHLTSLMEKQQIFIQKFLK